jgi:hypothetical protein
MKFRVRRTSDNLLYVQVKEGWFLWKTIRKDGEIILVHTIEEANKLAKSYFLFVKQQKKEDDILTSFVIK